jgi:hypothetical protein
MVCCKILRNKQDAKIKVFFSISGETITAVLKFYNQMAFLTETNKTLTDLVRVFCGAGGSRTRVQTRKSYAFYMLISA